MIHHEQQSQVRDDCETEVMRRSVAKQYVAGNTCVISVVTAAGPGAKEGVTLDFEIREVPLCLFVYLLLN